MRFNQNVARFKPFPEHVLEMYLLAPTSIRMAGMAWYAEAHDFARSLDADVYRAAGVIAAMSPLNGWTNNKRVAGLLYAGETASLGLSKNQAKAMRILNGEHPLEVLGGDKVRAFYSTILNPYDPESTPVIDRHAHDIAIGARLPNNHKSRSLTKGRYAEFASVYSTVARSIGIGAPQLQAITWLTWRDRWNLGWYG